MATKTQVSKPGAWKDTRNGIGIGKSLYTSDGDGKLFVTNTSSGEFAVLSEGTPIKFLTAGGSDAGDLYAIDDKGTLSRVDTDTGEWSQIGDDGAWDDTVALDAVGDLLYAVDTEGTLSQVEVGGEIEELGDGFDTKGLWAWQDCVYVLENDGTLYKVDTESGEFEVFGEESAYDDVLAATIHEGVFYTVEEDGSLSHTSLEDGGYEDDESVELSQARSLFSANGALFAIEKDGTLFRIEV